MKRTGTKDKSNKYDKKKEKLSLEKESENKAYRIAMNKMLKDLENKKKK